MAEKLKHQHHHQPKIVHPAKTRELELKEEIKTLIQEVSVYHAIVDNSLLESNKLQVAVHENPQLLHIPTARVESRLENLYKSGLHAGKQEHALLQKALLATEELLRNLELNGGCGCCKPENSDSFESRNTSAEDVNSDGTGKIGEKKKAKTKKPLL